MAQKHLIGKQVWDILIRSSDDAFGLQNELSQLYWESLVPELNKLFDRLVEENNVLQVDRITLDIGSIELKAGKMDDIVSKVINGLEAEILKLEPTQSNNRREGLENKPIATGQPLEKYHFDLWLYWLVQGSLPSYAPLPTKDWMEGVLATLGREASAVDRLQTTLKNNSIALRRLILQHRPKDLQSVTELYTGFSQTMLPEFLTEIASLLKRTPEIAKKIGFRKLEVKIWKSIFKTVILKRQKKESRALLEMLAPLPEFGILQNHWTETPAKNAATYPIFHRLYSTTAPLPEKENSKAPNKKETTEKAENSSDKKESKTKVNEDSHQEEYKDVTEATATDPIGKPKTQKDTDPSGKVDDKENSTKGTSKDHTTKEPSKGEETRIKKTKDTTSPNKEVVQSHPVDSENSTQAADDLDLSVYEEADHEMPSPQFFKNAGAVLVHPFLSPFFKKLKLTDAGAFKNFKTQSKAVLLIHFLATGEEKPQEYEMLLPKFLCGMPANLPLDHTLSLTKKEKKEANQLLLAAIDHWGALGKTSPDGLREGFLMREGKLAKEETGWKLYVEQKAQDILLDRLPWNLSMIKLPWMKEILKLEWR